MIRMAAAETFGQKYFNALDDAVQSDEAPAALAFAW
jgi:hypothetical protein